jgi:hypothetical protein
MKLQTTLTIIRAANPCSSGYTKLFRTLGPDWPANKPIDFTTILASNGLDDALWGLRAVLPQHERDRDRLARLFAADCAERVLPIFERVRPTDSRPRDAIAAARAFARGEITPAAQDAARAPARAAARAAVRAAQTNDFIRYFCLDASEGGVA